MAWRVVKNVKLNDVDYTVGQVLDRIPHSSFFHYFKEVPDELLKEEKPKKEKAERKPKKKKKGWF
jgi:hypothetical protein